jgi:hypothetical protein
MPRLRVIILAQTPDDPNTYQAALWADVPAARQSYYAKQNSAYVSAWSGATAADNTNIQNGSMVEQVVLNRLPSGSTAIAMQQALQNAWTAFQNSVTNNNYWYRYGSTWDGTTWVLTTGG